jgi:hypothetical protein
MYAIPCHVYDGGYQYGLGYISDVSINASGERNVHMLEMSLSKSIVGSTLSFSGSVTNLESQAFAGFMLVFITENHLIDPSDPETIWNYVFRDYGLNKTLNLAGYSEDTFSGTWNIPSGVNSTNIHVVAATYNTNTKDAAHGWPYAVQSVCDICAQSVAVPELSDVLVCMLVIILAYSTTLLAIQRKTLGKAKNKNNTRTVK